jgi:hypothetical protein
VAPEGFYYTIEGRSSLWELGILPYRGIIDATYTGPLSVYMLNNSPKDYTVSVGDKIAQIILHRINDFDIVPDGGILARICDSRRRRIRLLREVMTYLNWREDYSILAFQILPRIPLRPPSWHIPQEVPHADHDQPADEGYT